MQLSELLDYTLGALLITMFDVIIMKKTFDMKLNENKIKVYLALIVGSLIIAIINITNKDMFKAIFIIPTLSIIVSYVLNQKILDSFIMTLITSLYMFISELFVALIVSILNIQDFLLLDSIFGSSIGNIIVIILATPLLQIQSLKKYLNIMRIWLKKENIFGIIILLFVSALISSNANNITNIFQIIINAIITISFIIIIVFLFKEYKKIDILSNKYNVLFSYLKEYEKELTEKRKIVHDYNNQLIIINSYAEPRNKKLKNYLSCLLQDSKENFNNSINKKYENIPEGLKGLIFYKINANLDKINVKLYVDENVKNIKIPDVIVKDYLKIAGVLLDNAFESSLLSSKKEISIFLKIISNKFDLQIQNYFVGKVELSKIYNSGYSTKGENRGYGLTLVKEILNKTDKIKIAINIIENKFIAIQTIDI